MVPNGVDSQRDRSIWLSNWCSCKPSSAPRTRSGCTPCEEQRSKVRSSSVAPCPHTHTACAYHPIATFRPDVHLSVVFGVVLIVEEGGLTLAELDHAAVVGVALPVVAEKLAAHHVSTREQQVSTRPAQQEVLTWGQLTPPGRGCTGQLFACRMRSRFPWCSGRSSIFQPQ